MRVHQVQRVMAVSIEMSTLLVRLVCDHMVIYTGHVESVSQVMDRWLHKGARLDIRHEIFMLFSKHSITSGRRHHDSRIDLVQWWPATIR